MGESIQTFPSRSQKSQNSTNGSDYSEDMDDTMMERNKAYGQNLNAKSTVNTESPSSVSVKVKSFNVSKFKTAQDSNGQIKTTDDVRSLQHT